MKERVFSLEANCTVYITLSEQARRTSNWSSILARSIGRIQQVAVLVSEANPRRVWLSRRVPMPLLYLLLLLRLMRQKRGHVFARVLLRRKFILSFDTYRKPTRAQILASRRVAKHWNRAERKPISLFSPVASCTTAEHPVCFNNTS